MAKTVKPFELRLKVLGDEAVKKLGSSFRDLDKALNISNNKIKQLRNEVLSYNKEGQQSEQLIKGQITALKSLQGQVQVNGKVYQKLGADVANLKAKLDGTTSSVQEQRAAILKNVSAQKLSSATAAKYVSQLQKLKSQTVENSKASKEFEQDIDKLKTKLAELRAEEGKAFGEGAKGAFAGLINGGQKATNAVDAIGKRLSRLGREARTASGAWNRILEGLGALGVGASAAGPALSGLQIGAAANAAKLSFQQGAADFLGKIPGGIGDYMQGRSAELQSALADAHKFESVLQGLHSATDGILSAFAQIGPEAAVATALGGAAFAGLFDLIKKHTNETEGELKGAVSRIRNVFESMSMELPKLLREYRRLSSEQIGGLLSGARGEFALRPAGSARSRALASQIAGLESIGAQEAARQADVLEEYRRRVRGTREDAQALGDRLAYVQGKLKTLDQTTEEGRAEFAQYSNEAISLTDKLNRLADGYRHVSTMATQAATAQQNAANAATRLNYFNFGAAQAQRQAMAELGQRVRAGVAGTPLALPAAGQTTAPGTGQAISGGARQFRGAVETTFDDPNFRRARTRGIRAGYYSPTTADVGQPAAVGMSGQAIQAQAAAAKKAAVDLTQYRTAIRQARQANTGSIASTNNLRQALVAMREQLDPTSNKFRALTRQIERLDAQSAKYAINQRKRGGLGRNVRAGVGSALSGAIFGGPEAAIGGLVGGIAGGIAGGAAGAGLGAQASMLRQSLAGTADYAAQIGKLQIALRGVAGSQEQFTKAMRAAADVTKTLNIPQETAISGMTRLSAAIRGAGGNVTDAEVVFRNVTQAIKATGGSAEDVQSAITAMVQVFSKGKVSAEEISGQLGERLPGAVTLFAKANNMSLTDLQKALKAGTVGLNELMKFVDELGERYGKTSGTIAKSSEDAGARLTVSINNMRLAVGKALQPIGAEFQDAFGQFIEEITPALVSAADTASTAIKLLADNFRNIVNITGFIAVITGVNYALKALAALSGPLKTFFLLLQAQFGAASAQAVAAQAKVKAFALTVKALAAALAPTIVVSVALVGGAIVLNWLERIKKAKQGLIDKQNAPVGDAFLKSIGGDAATKATIRRNLADINKAYDQYTSTIYKRGLRLNKLINEQRLLQQGGFVTAQAAKGLQTKIDVLQAEQDEDITAYTNLQRNREALERRLSSAPDDPRTNFATLAGDDPDGSKKKLMTEAEANLRIKILGYEEKEQRIKAINAKYDLDMLLASQETEDLQRRRVMQAEAEKNKSEAILNLHKGMTDEFLKQKALGQDLNRELEDRKFKLGLITEEQYNQSLLDRERRRLEDTYGNLPGAEGKIEEGMALYKQEIDPTPFQEMKQNIAQLKQELTDLLNPVNQITGAANAIGTAFSTSFINVINGSQTAKEALASFFKNIGNYFLDMAAQIIAKMIQMAILNSIVGLLPGAPAAGAGAGAGSMGGLNMPTGIGDSYKSLLIPKRAYGGPVKGKMPYIVGENGPELYVPGMSGKIVPNHKLPKMVDLGGKFMPFSPLILALMSGQSIGNFAGPMAPFMMSAMTSGFADRYPQYAGGTAPIGALVGRAAGGPVTGGSPYLVGESGPEMYVPQGFSAGSMKSTSNNVVVNVNASGSQAEGDGPDSKRLGEAIGAAVRQELMRQQRPGGILA